MRFIRAHDAGCGLWHVTQRKRVLRVAYRVGEFNIPQYCALHLDSSYFRLCPSVVCGWGTSVVLLPAFWSHGRLLQGAPVTVEWEAIGDDLHLYARGKVGRLDVDLDLTLDPPSLGHIIARVHGQSRGEMPLDQRPGEAFRLVTLSSMRVADHLWDACIAYADDKHFEIDRNGWFLPTEPVLQAREFGLVGGTSKWKVNAPTIGIALDRPRQIAGWRTPSDCTSDDNLSLWAAETTSEQTWDYTIHAWRPSR